MLFKKQKQTRTEKKDGEQDPKSKKGETMPKYIRTSEENLRFRDVPG